MIYIRSYKLNYISLFSRYDQLIWKQELALMILDQVKSWLMGIPLIPIAGGNKKSEILVFMEIPSIETDAFSSLYSRYQTVMGRCACCREFCTTWDPRFFQWQEFLSNQQQDVYFSFPELSLYLLGFSSPIKTCSSQILENHFSKNAGH